MKCSKCTHVDRKKLITLVISDHTLCQHNAEIHEVPIKHKKEPGYEASSGVSRLACVEWCHDHHIQVSPLQSCKSYCNGGCTFGWDLIVQDLLSSLSPMLSILSFLPSLLPSFLSTLFLQTWHKHLKNEWLPNCAEAMVHGVPPIWLQASPMIPPPVLLRSSNEGTHQRCS